MANICRILRRNDDGLMRTSNMLAIWLGISLAVIMRVDSRELRPSEHGLPFQGGAASAPSPEMEFFFGEEFSPPAKRPPYPPAILGNPAPDSWWKGRQEDRVRKALVVATVVCGGTGVVLLAAAAALFLVHFRRQRQRAVSSGGGDENSNNSTAIVVAAPVNPSSHNK